jgi:hypothetical protein
MSLLLACAFWGFRASLRLPMWLDAMKVFLSWAQDESRQMARAMRTFLMDTLPGLTVFMSEYDIEGGERWGARLAKELEETNFGVFLLTPGSVKSQWLIYEAGAVAKLPSGRVHGLLRGVSTKDIAGPLTQFQHKPFGREACHTLVEQLNRASESRREPASLTRAFEKFYPDLETAVEGIKSEGLGEGELSPRSVDVVLEELVIRVRGLERMFIDDLKPEWPSIVKASSLGAAGIRNNYERRFKTLPTDLQQLLLDFAKAGPIHAQGQLDGLNEDTVRALRAAGVLAPERRFAGWVESVLQYALDKDATEPASDPR